MVITSGSTTPQTRSTELSNAVVVQTLALDTVASNSDREESSCQEHKTKRIVVKFGGSSLADSERITSAARLISKESTKGTKLVVVVSAIGKTTDQLMGLVNHNSNKQLEKTDLDDVLSMGERTSVRVFAAALKGAGLDARYFDPSDEAWPIITDDEFSNANPIVDLCLQRIRKHVVPVMNGGTIPVIAGFVGRSTDGKISTIGRGGSDTTAFIMAKGIGADEVVLVTDADGILSADPKLVPNPKKLDKIDVRTLIGLADSGTKFIHRKALRYKDADIPVRVINHRSEDLNSDGTVITGGISNEVEVTFESSTPAMAITVAGKGISENPAILATMIKEVRTHSSLDGLSADFDSIILYVPQNGSDRLVKSVHDCAGTFTETVAIAVQQNLAFLRIKGVGLEDTPGIIGRISTLLRERGINIYGMLTISSSILVFVGWDEKEQAMTLMKQVIKGEL